MSVIDKFCLEEVNVCFLEDVTAKEAITTLVNNLQSSINGRKIEVIDKVMEREEISSTALGLLVAIPHGRCNFLENFSLSIGVCKGKGIDWKGMDELFVKIVCLIAGPENKPCEYLSVLSFITSLLKEEPIRLKILNETNKKNIVNIFAT